MVQLARERDHEVAFGDAVAFLEEVEPVSLGGVFCAHFLEHLQPEDVARVYRAAARALRPGGRFVAAVPNAGSLSVLGYDFWRDPTHIRFYDPMLLGFFAGQAGLSVLDSGGNPRNDPGPPPLLTPLDFVPAASLTESVAGLWSAVTEAYPAVRPEHGRRRPRRENGGGEGGEIAVLPDPSLNPQARPWSHVVHLLSVLDERAQLMQHQYAELHRAYKALLRQLYPPNEVYVVAVAPDPDPGVAE
jgi:SAM-dependent methyltransferase